MSQGWGYAAASVIGTSHLKKPDEICQDYHACAFIESIGAFVGVVSDGAGSASRSAEGSQLACAVVLRECNAVQPEYAYSREFALNVLSAVRKEISAAATDLNLRNRDFACTLLVAIIGPEQVAFWQIGDGAICFRLQGQDTFRFAFWPAKGEYANVTEFVTDENSAAELCFDGGIFPIEDLALFSDGLERLALDFALAEVHTPFLSALFPYLHRRGKGRLSDIDEQLTTFLGSDRINSRTDDDKTLILATRGKEHAH